MRSPVTQPRPPSQRSGLLRVFEAPPRRSAARLGLRRCLVRLLLPMPGFGRGRRVAGGEALFKRLVEGFILVFFGGVLGFGLAARLG